MSVRVCRLQVGREGTGDILVGWLRMFWNYSEVTLVWNLPDARDYIRDHVFSIQQHVMLSRKRVYARKPSTQSKRARTLTLRKAPASSSTLRTKRSAFFTNISTSLAGETDTGYTFQLSDLSNYTEFTALFDQYRFRNVTVHFTPDLRNAQIGSTCADASVYTAIDRDSGQAVTLNEIVQYSDVKKNDGLSPFKVLVRNPKYAVAAYSGAFTSYAQASGWVDCSSPSVQHYGLHVVCPTAVGNSQTYRIFVTYDLEFRHVR